MGESRPGAHGQSAGLLAERVDYFRSRLAIATISLLLAANIIVPLLWGDVYPFTSAPMFRDSPRQFSNYHVYAPSGEALPLENWNLQRIYDGNPIGYGVGVRPPPVLEQEFGVIQDQATVRQHVERQFERLRNADYAFVDVVQETIGPVDSRRVGVTKTETWRIPCPPTSAWERRTEASKGSKVPAK